MKKETVKEIKKKKYHGGLYILVSLHRKDFFWRFQDELVGKSFRYYKDIQAFVPEERIDLGKGGEVSTEKGFQPLDGAVFKYA